MNGKNCSKTIALVLTLLGLMLFGALAIFAQIPTLRANGKIAFTSDRDGNREIYVMDPDGGKQTRITENGLFNDHPTWSPDGGKIAFISQRPSGAYAIFQMNADGTGKTEITPINFQPSPYYATGWTIGWSPDGRQLVFTDLQGNSDIVVIVNADGSGRRTLTSGYGPSWSPDGSKILFVRGAFPWILYMIRPDGTDLRNLPQLPDFYNWYYDATWSPAGDQIATTAFDGANEVVFIANADGTDPRYFYSQCSSSPRGCSRLAAPSWSPDGKSLVLLVWGVQSGQQIQVVDIADGVYRQLTDTVDGNNSNPNWQSLTMVTVSGRVTTPSGQGLRNAVVSLTDSLGVRQTATTSSFGFYSFANIPTGETYTVSVASRLYRLTPRTITVNDNLTDIDFVGLE